MAAIVNNVKTELLGQSSNSLFASKVAESSNSYNIMTKQHQYSNLGVIIADENNHQSFLINHLHFLQNKYNQINHICIQQQIYLRQISNDSKHLDNKQRNILNTIEDFNFQKGLYQIDIDEHQQQNTKLESFITNNLKCIQSWQEKTLTSKIFKSQLSLKIITQLKNSLLQRNIPGMNTLTSQLEELVNTMPNKSKHRLQWGNSICELLKNINQQILKAIDKNSFKINNRTKDHQLLLDKQQPYKQSLQIIQRSQDRQKQSITNNNSNLMWQQRELFLLQEEINHCQTSIQLKQQIIKEHTDNINTIAGDIQTLSTRLPTDFIKLNIPTFINDIIVTQPRDSTIFGVKGDNDDIVKKICIQIKVLFNQASKNHNENLNQENNITRLSTDEFSFYTNEPITQLQYQEIITFLECKLKLLPDNIHFVLTSFAVLDENNFVRNVIIHCQSGYQPKIHHSCKAFYSKIDPGFKQPLIVRPTSESLTGSPMMLEVKSNAAIQWGYGTVLHIKTNFNSEYLTNIQICYDLKKKHGRQNLLWAIELYKQQEELIPIFYSSILTSRSAPLITFDKLTANILQVDAQHVGKWSQADKTKPLITSPPLKVEFDTTNFDHIKKLTYMPSQLLSTMPDTVQQNITQHNESILGNSIISLESQPTL